MNRFIELKRRGNIITISDIFKEIPSDEVLCELFPDPDHPSAQLITQRELQVLKLRLDGFKQPEIATQLNLTPGQVAYSSMNAKNCLRKYIPPYIEIDLPALRKILGMKIHHSKRYERLSELLSDMPSDEELEQLFLDAGNIIGEGHKPPVTNRDLRLLQMRYQKRDLENIGVEVGLDANEVQHLISLALKRIRRYLRLEMDVPELYKRRGPKSSAKAENPELCPATSAHSDDKPLSVLSIRQRDVWVLLNEGLTRKQIADRLGITYNAVAEHIRHAERRFREYDRYNVAKEKNKENVFLPLTRGEVKVIIRALEIYEEQLEKTIVHRVESDWAGKLPFEANIIADIYERAQMVAYGSILHRMPPNWDEDK